MALKNFLEFRSLRNVKENSIFINEAFSNNDAEKALRLIETYLSKKMGKFVRWKNVQEFTSSGIKGVLYGYKYFTPNDTVLRINWLKGSSTSIHSISIFGENNFHTPIQTLCLEGFMSVALILPLIVELVKNPSVDITPKKLLQITTKGSAALKGMFESEEDLDDLDYETVLEAIQCSEVGVLEALSNSEAIEFQQLLKLGGKGRTGKQTGRYHYLKNKGGAEQMGGVPAGDSSQMAVGGNGIVVRAVKQPSEKDLKRQEEIERLQRMKEFRGSDPDEQFEFMRRNIRLVVKGIKPCLLITGTAGVGKTHSVEEEIKLEGLIEDVNWVMIGGKVSPQNIYRILYKYRKPGQVVVFDDCDSVFKDPDGINVLKKALDSKPVRKVSWYSSLFFDPDKFLGGESSEEYQKAIAEGKVPNTFEFAANVIFVSNMKPEEFANDDDLNAIYSRSLKSNIELSPDQVRARLMNLLPYIAPIGDEYMENKLALVSIFDKMLERKLIQNLDFRTFVNSYECFISAKDEYPEDKLVKYIHASSIGGH